MSNHQEPSEQVKPKTVAQCSIEELIAEIHRLAQASSAVGNRAIGDKLEQTAKHLPPRRRNRPPPRSRD